MRSNTPGTPRRLTRKQLSYLRAKLMERRRALLSHLEIGLQNGLKANGHGTSDDLLDKALVDAERETSFQIAEMESTAVGQINDAIDRINRGAYGVCEVCGAPIPPARLRALPSATLCIECKSQLEREESRTHNRGYGKIPDPKDSLLDPEAIYGTIRGRKVS